MNSFPQQGPILGVDYGEQKVGLAISSPDRKFVFGRGIVRSASIDHLLDHLRAICSEEGAVAVVIGLPFTEKGKDTTLTERIRRMAERVQRELRLPVFLEDERYSSKLARQLSGSSADDDEGAARVILESAIQRQQP